MKLLGWMHRKLMQNGIQAINNSIIGNTSACLSMQTLSKEQNYYKTLSSHSNIISRKPSNGLTKFELVYQEEPFDFLSIGTFGMELLNNDPPTPTLPIPVEKVTDTQQIDITENNLNLMINYELEKFLDAEEMDVFNDMSQRSSQASVITLSYKAVEGSSDSEGHIHCPLQNYLFAASVHEVAEMDREVKRERISLGELFKRNNLVHDHDNFPMKKCEEILEKEAYYKKGNVAHLMKKMVNKFHPSSDKDSAASNTTKKKLPKALLKMLNKKVYPEEMIKNQLIKPSKCKKKSTSNEDDHHKFDHQPATKKSKKNTMNLSWIGICKGASPVNNSGHWIRTDSDYLVLEL